MEEQDFISIHRFARMWKVTVRTVRNWINEDRFMKAATIRRNRTLFMDSGVIDEFIQRYRRVDNDG